MKVAILQSTFAGFFPRYYKALYDTLISGGNEVCVYGNKNSVNNRSNLSNQVLFGSRWNWHIHHFLYKIIGIREVFSFFDTLDLIFKIKRFGPDVIHLNVINSCILNMPMLVRYVNNNRIPVVWTMHDCRAFTAFCTYPDEQHCNEWKTRCKKCPVLDTLIDNSRMQWKINYKWNGSFNNLTIVTPSQWLANFVHESFLNKYSLKVIYNGVDTKAFSTPSKFDVRKEYNINTNKKIVLGCAINWEPRKGLNFFEKLTEMLPSEYQIVLIGGIDKERKYQLIQKNIICTGRTSTFDEMVAWYQNASVFCNPTLADNFPTTNIEALAAGTPIVTFRTGGSPEAIDEQTGIVVEQGDTNALCNAICTICEHRDRYTSDACRSRSQIFSLLQYEEYISLYRSLL